LVEVPKTEDKIDELMAQYKTNKPQITFDTSKIFDEKPNKSKSSSASKSRFASKQSDIQDKIKRQEEEI
tara:strand:- start:935 stop:1141 length:207 start_codon:yes stop_codon:yes gene_type:complete